VHSSRRWAASLPRDRRTLRAVIQAPYQVSAEHRGAYASLSALLNLLGLARVKDKGFVDDASALLEKLLVRRAVAEDDGHFRK